MVQEATAPATDSLDHGHAHSPRYEQLSTLWAALQQRGVAAPIDAKLIYYVVIGTTSLMYINRAEARMLLRGEPGERSDHRQHVAGIVAMLLPHAELS